MPVKRRRGRWAVKVPAPVADWYRSEAARRDRHISQLLLEELASAVSRAKRGVKLPPAPHPGNRRGDGAEMVQMKWTQDAAAYAACRDALARCGSSPTAVLRHPRRFRGV